MTASIAAALHKHRVPSPVAGAIVFPLLQQATRVARRVIRPAPADTLRRRSELLTLQAFLLAWRPALRQALADDSFITPRLPADDELAQRWLQTGGRPTAWVELRPDAEAASLCNNLPAALGSLYAVQLWLAGNTSPGPLLHQREELPASAGVDADSRLQIKGTVARLAGLSPEEAAEAAEGAARTLQFLRRRQVQAPLGRP